MDDKCVCTLSVKRLATVYNYILLLVFSIIFGALFFNVRFSFDSPEMALSCIACMFFDIVIVLVLFGMHKEKPKLMYPYLFVQIIGTTCLFIIALASAFLALASVSGRMRDQIDPVTFAIASLIGTGLFLINIYFGLHMTNRVRILIEKKLKKKAHNLNINLEEKVESIEMSFCQKSICEQSDSGITDLA